MSNYYVIYARVSSKGQGDRFGMDSQIDACQNYVERVGGEIVAEFKEIASSKGKRRGKKISIEAQLARRPELVKAVDACLNTNAILLAYDMSRYGRNIAIFSWLDSQKIDIKNVAYPEANIFTMRIMAAVAEQDNEMRSERTKQGIQKFVEKGGKMGGLNDGTMKNLAKAVRMKKEIALKNPNLIRVKGYINMMRQNGMSYGQIARTLNREGFNTLTTKGKWCAGNVEYVYTHYILGKKKYIAEQDKETN